MKSLFDKIEDVLQNPEEVFESNKESPTLNKTAFLLTAATAITAVFGVPNAQAHIDSSHHVHYEHAQILGESVLVKDHIQNVSDKFGISLDQNNDYLNYEHPQHSKINDFIKHAGDNYSTEAFEEIKGLVEKAQQHFNNGHYEKLDEHANHLMSRTDDSPIFVKTITPKGETYDFNSDRQKNLEATVELFNLMAEDDSFDYDGQSIKIKQEYYDYDRNAVLDVAEEQGFVMTYFNEEGATVTGLNIAAWKISGQDVDNNFYKQMKNHDYVVEKIGEAYDLTDLDKEKIKNIRYAHEAGHLNKFQEIENVFSKGPQNEFLAETMGIWDSIQDGASEGFLEFRKDTTVSGIALKGETGPHSGYGFVKTFYDQFSYEEVKNMSFDEITGEVRDFVNMIPDESLEFGTLALLTSSEEVSKNGAFPKAQEYFKNKGDTEMYDFLQSTKNIPYTDTAIKWTAQLDILENPESGFVERFTANHFPDSLNISDYQAGFKEKTGLEKDYVNQLNEHISSGNHLNSEFEYFNRNTPFYQTDTFVMLSDNVKIDSNANMHVNNKDLSVSSYDLSMEVVTKMKEDSLSLEVHDHEDNTLLFNIKKTGDITVSMNGEEPEKVQEKHFQGFNAFYGMNDFLEPIQEIARENTKQIDLEFLNMPMEETPSFEMQMEVENTPSFKPSVENNNVEINDELKQETKQSSVLDNSDEENELLSGLSAEINDIEKQENKSNKLSNRGNRLSNL